MNDDFLQQHWQYVHNYGMKYCTLLIHYFNLRSYQQQQYTFVDWILQDREFCMSYASRYYSIELANYIYGSRFVNYDHRIDQFAAYTYLLIAGNKTNIHLIQKHIKPLTEQTNNQIKEQYCPICITREPDSLIDTCKHVFCNECINFWIQSNNTCPICRQTIEYKLKYYI